MQQLVVPIYSDGMFYLQLMILQLPDIFQRKTSEKIFHRFFWSGAGADIGRYCRSCPVCQKFSPEGKVRKVPLESMPS